MSGSFWACLSETQREEFARLAEERAFDPGRVLCREKTWSSDAIVIRSGWVKITARVDGRDRIIAVRGPGDLVGERTALTLRPRSATVVALGPVAGLLVPTRRFQRFVLGEPGIAAVLERQERERLAEDDHLLGEDTERRLAYLLHELAQRTSGGRLDLPMSRREVARWVDADTEDVGRVLTGWQRRGIVDARRRGLVLRDARRLAEISAGRPAWSSLTCAILFTDVAGFSSPDRDESDRQVVRDRLYEILRLSFETSDVPWDACYHEDRGDGVLIVVPPEIPTRSVADPLLLHLAAELRRHNRRSSDAVRIRLRAALHVGPVTRDREGLNGDAVIHTARMLDAPPMREAISNTGADLAFMASDHVYRTVLRNGSGLLDPESFTNVNFRNKESDITAWMHVEGRPASAPARPQPKPEPAPSGGEVGGVHFHETVHIKGDLVLGDKHEIHHD